MSTLSQRPLGEHPHELGTGELVLAVLLAATGIVAGAADVAGTLVSGGGFCAPTRALGVLVDALRGSPTPLVWPGDATALSRIAFLVVVGLLVAVCDIGVIVLARYVLLCRSGGGGFATRAELEGTAGLAAARRNAHLTRPRLSAKEAKHALAEDVGYRLGMSLRPRGVQLVASFEHSLELVAPPGAGKTLRVLAPILRQHPGPVLATSTKPDLYEVSLVARQRRGPVVALDPERLCPGAAPLLWSPISGCRDARVAERRAGALVAAAGDGADVRGGGFFRRSAAAVLAAYLHAAALEDASMRDVLAWATRPSDPAPLKVLVSSGDGAIDWAARLSSHTTGAEETTSGVMRTVDLALGCFADPHVLASCAVTSDAALDLGTFLEENGTIYALGKDRGELGGTAPLVTAFCDELLVIAEQLSAMKPGRRLDPPLLACLDEAPSVAPLPGLPALLADGRGRGIVTLVAMQSFSQAAQRWGRDGAATIRNAASILMVFGGLSVVSDLEELARLAGTHRVKRASWSHDANGRSSVTNHLADELVLTPGDVRSLRPGTALCFFGRLPPVLVHLPALFEGREAKELALEEHRARRANDDARHLMAASLRATTTAGNTDNGEAT